MGGIFGEMKNPMYFCAIFGGMAEWSIAAVLKTVDLHGSGGSNPSLSANEDADKQRAAGQCPAVFYL